MSTLEIKNLHVEAEDNHENKILKGLNMKFETGKVYAVIGANGNGKSTLLASIMGDPNYVVTKGSITLDGEEITEMEVDERARKGIFLGMQYPSEIAGVGNLELIRNAVEKTTGKPASPMGVYADLLGLAEELRIDEETLEREVNVGFSGGEKKKNELIQMFTLKPKFALLDEVDSGLDVDSIAAVAKKIAKEVTNDKAYIIVSHYKELYEVIKPDVVVIIKDGQVLKTGDYDLLMETLNKGFDNA